MEQAEAEKLQAATKAQCKKDASNFLIPPTEKMLSSLSSIAGINTNLIASPIFLSSTKRVSNNTQDVAADSNDIVVVDDNKKKNWFKLI
jgi:hypothetical protein